MVDANSSTARADDLLRDADVALYRAKAEGTGFKAFEPEMNDWAARRHALRQALGLAIERGELSVAFQPIVAMSSGRVVSFEALLRWAIADFGQVSPAEFIPIAEESGLMRSIGEWVFEQRCAGSVALALRDQGFGQSFGRSVPRHQPDGTVRIDAGGDRSRSAAAGTRSDRN